MADNSSSAGGGIGFTRLLTIAFIVLKLTGVIGWSWLWVLAPLWIGFGLLAVIIGGVLGVAGVLKIADSRKKRIKMAAWRKEMIERDKVRFGR